MNAEGQTPSRGNEGQMINAGRARCRVEQLVVCSRVITLRIDSMFDGDLGSSFANWNLN